MKKKFTQFTRTLLLSMCLDNSLQLGRYHSIEFQKLQHLLQWQPLTNAPNEAVACTWDNKNYVICGSTNLHQFKDLDALLNASLDVKTGMYKTLCVRALAVKRACEIANVSLNNAIIGGFSLGGGISHVLNRLIGEEVNAKVITFGAIRTLDHDAAKIAHYLIPFKKHYSLYLKNDVALLWRFRDKFLIPPTIINDCGLTGWKLVTKLGAYVSAFTALLGGANVLGGHSHLAYLQKLTPHSDVSDDISQLILQMVKES
jgi:hypothetical protein